MIGTCPTCGGTTENAPYSCSNCVAAIKDPLDDPIAEQERRREIFRHEHGDGDGDW